MGRFTQLCADDIERACAAFGVGDVIGFDEIVAGTINSNYAVRTPGGRLFLRVNEGKSERDVVYEAELVDALAARRVPTPRPHRAADGRPFAVLDGQYVSLFDWVDGDHRSVESVTAQDAHAVGRALALLHRAGAEIAGDFDRAGIYTFADIVARLDSFRDSSDPELADAIAIVSDEAKWLEARAGVRSAATRGIIHGDLFRDNVMFEGEALTGMIDFEQASTGSLAYDLAVCINAWCFSDRFVEDRMTAMEAGYESIRPLTAEDRAALPVELRAAAMRFTVTRITDVYLPKVELPGKDFHRYLARLTAWRST